MKGDYRIPEIPESEQTPTVKMLLLLLEHFAHRIQEQDEEITRLKDEISRLKGQSPRPKLKGNRLIPGLEKRKTASSKGKVKRPGSAKRAKTSALPIHEEVYVYPDGPIPADARFKGYQDFVVQELQIQAHNTRYRLGRWLTREGKMLRGHLPFELKGRHFGPQLISYILYQHHHCQTTQPLLLEQLREWGIEISSGQIDRLLSGDWSLIHEEKRQLLRTGLSVSDYVTVDDSGARHRGKNGYVTQIGNELFAWFSSTGSKSRINFLELLRGAQSDYHLSASALTYMQSQKLPSQPLNRLRSHLGQSFSDQRAWEAFLSAEQITNGRHVRIATEGALLGSGLHHGMNEALAIISDGAGQFNVLTHGLCWVHMERLIHKLIPLNEYHQQDIAKVRESIWQLYRGLKCYRRDPTPTQGRVLSEQFDAIFSERTRYATLNGLLRRILEHKAQLLLVLDRPRVPLHTNGSERDIRDYVKRRKVSGGTRSEQGRQCRDTFASMKKTCRKLGISFWAYLLDRVRGDHLIPQLPDIIQQRANATTF